MALKIDAKFEGKVACAFTKTFGKYAQAEINQQQI